MKVCPACGSADVEELLAGWFKANDPDGPGDDLSEAELYTERYWCPTCEAHPSRLEER